MNSFDKTEPEVGERTMSASFMMAHSAYEAGTFDEEVRRWFIKMLVRDAWRYLA